MKQPTEGGRAYRSSLGEILRRRRVMGEELPVRLHQDQRRRGVAPVRPNLTLNL